MTGLWLTTFTSRGDHPVSATMDACVAHALVVAAAVGVPDPIGGRLLWARPEPTRWVVQTSRPVSAGAFPPGFLAAPVEHRDVSAVLSALTRGDVVRFGGLINAARNRRATVARKRVNRVRIMDPHRTVDWFRTRAEGLSVRSLTARRGRVSGRQPTRNISLTVDHVTGEATVVSVDGLRATLAMGIGQGKAYGCGLVVIE